jgi:hypothetical protein
MAGPYPLATLACTVSATGISSPPYSDIYASLQASFQGLYGSDSYLDPDSQDGQMLAILAQAQSDSNNATISTYNNFSPATAQGTGLSSVVKINGIARDVPTFSQVAVNIVGQAGTQIGNGSVLDQNGNQWNLDFTLLIIPDGGAITTTVTCATPGAITADANTIVQINTPTAGWQSVTNPVAATPGAPVETDAALRQRQSQSTALPALTVSDALEGQLLSLAGVLAALVFENPTGSVDADDLPAHSIAAVVDGGDANVIAETVANQKNPGCATFGTTSEVVLNSQGLPIDINFSFAALTHIKVNITIKALAGYSSLVATYIAQALSAYTASLGIAAVNSDRTVMYTALFSPAKLNGDAATSGTGLAQTQLDVFSRTFNITAMTTAKDSGAFQQLDIDVAYNQLPYTDPVADVTVTVT